MWFKINAHKFKKMLTGSKNYSRNPTATNILRVLAFENIHASRKKSMFQKLFMHSKKMFMCPNNYAYVYTKMDNESGGKSEELTNKNKNKRSQYQLKKK